MLDYKEKKINIDRISKIIHELRRYRIEFYEGVLQEYTARKNEYNKLLKEKKEFEPNRISKDRNNVPLRPSGVDTAGNLERDGIFHEEIYELDVIAYHRDDLKKATDKYRDSNLKSYWDNTLCGYRKGIDYLFEIFFIFKTEMSYIAKIQEDQSLESRTLSVLLDFLEEFKANGDLEEVVVGFIEDLEEYKFISLRDGQSMEEKNITIDRISKMIFELRRHHIESYNLILDAYLREKDKYNKDLSKLI